MEEDEIPRLQGRLGEYLVNHPFEEQVLNNQFYERAKIHGSLSRLREEPIQKRAKQIAEFPFDKEIQFVANLRREYMIRASMAHMLLKSVFERVCVRNRGYFEGMPEIKQTDLDCFEIGWSRAYLDKGAEVSIERMKVYDPLLGELLKIKSEEISVEDPKEDNVTVEENVREQLEMAGYLGMEQTYNLIARVKEKRDLERMFRA